MTLHKTNGLKVFCITLNPKIAVTFPPINGLGVGRFFLGYTIDDVWASVNKDYGAIQNIVGGIDINIHGQILLTDILKNVDGEDLGKELGIGRPIEIARPETTAQQFIMNLMLVADKFAIPEDRENLKSILERTQSDLTIKS